ncbi:AAA domain-containing protein [Pontibacter silvestris]|uniref:AAA domain-containing protein n=1 Tax=Pontibacter silvestris TaxID=2305183 RepID=A0ABW4X0L4_9BACT|nr:AAA domain-containing protein [Pontibacter silvestris]MCC9138714.1 AAA family ATPase [Pontibacter silvestris]
MNISQDKHIEFYEWQIQVIEEEWKRYANTRMQTLVQENRLFVGRIWGIQESQGNVVLRFKAGSVPRMKQPYILCMVGPDASPTSAEWDFTYLKFRESVKPRLCGLNTDIRTLNYLKTDDEKWSYILVSGFDEAILNQIKKNFLDHKKHPLIVVAETDPPVDYLIALKDYVRRKPEDNTLTLDVDVQENSWSPTLIDNKDETIREILSLIENQDVTVLQGPPGTGKSHLAAEVCDFYTGLGKSVCVTALTNKALIEIAAKNGMLRSLKRGSVFKTNLSSDEAKKFSLLKPVLHFAPREGEILLSTYYKLALNYLMLVEDSKRYDLIIIEEASQAYLATIAMFKSIAAKVLIIGDHKQLTPVVINKDEAKKIHTHIEGVINGLQTFAFNNSSISYRLINTRRLTSEGARLTGLYYENSLKSTSDLENITSFNSSYSHLFHPNGGVSIAKLQSSMIGFTEQNLLKFMSLIGREILSNDKQIEVALLSPYARVESNLYEQYSRLSSDYSRVTINTIHKIQGLTSDLTILYLPLDNPSFDLNDNLFNVATSRAKRGTFIVTYQHIELLRGVTPETLFFLRNCKGVSLDFMEAFRKKM